VRRGDASGTEITVVIGGSYGAALRDVRRAYGPRSLDCRSPDLGDAASRRDGAEQLRRDNIEAKGGTWSIEKSTNSARRRGRNSKARASVLCPPPGYGRRRDIRRYKIGCSVLVCRPQQRADRAHSFGLFRM